MKYFLYFFAAFLMLLTFWGCQSTDSLVDPTTDGINNPGKSDGQTDWVRPARGYRICGTVYFDENENGQMDNGEQGIPGIQVDLSNGWHRVTDANGNYCFYPVPNGDYTVTVIVPDGYSLTTAESIDVTIAGASVGDVDFGLTDDGPDLGFPDGDYSICGTVYWWTKLGRAPAEGVEVTLIYDGEDVLSTTSDENGEYCFSDLGNGDFGVRLDGVYVFGGNPRWVTIDGGHVTGIDFRCVPN
jgi:hypothetical protein